MQLKKIPVWYAWRPEPGHRYKQISRRTAAEMVRTAKKENRLERSMTVHGTRQYRFNDGERSYLGYIVMVHASQSA